MLISQSIIYFRYSEVANNVQMQETLLNIQFVLLDCAPLKFSILGHCQEWQNKFTSLLYDIATAKLNELHVFLKTNAEKWVINCYFFHLSKFIVYMYFNFYTFNFYFLFTHTNVALTVAYSNLQIYTFIILGISYLKQIMSFIY